MIFRVTEIPEISLRTIEPHIKGTGSPPLKYFKSSMVKTASASVAQTVGSFVPFQSQGSLRGIFTTSAVHTYSVSSLCPFIPQRSNPFFFINFFHHKVKPELIFESLRSEHLPIIFYSLPQKSGKPEKKLFSTSSSFTFFIRSTRRSSSTSRRVTPKVLRVRFFG